MKREFLTQRRQSLKAGVPGRITVDQAFAKLTGAEDDQDNDDNDDTTDDDGTNDDGTLTVDDAFDQLTGNEGKTPTQSETPAWWVVEGTVPAPKKGYWSVMLHVHGKKDEALNAAKSFYSGIGKTFRLISINQLKANEKPDPKRMIKNLQNLKK